MTTDRPTLSPQNRIERSREAGSARLSKESHQCLTLATRGMTSADIAFKLDISARTVNFHFSNIMQKLGALNRYEAISLALSQRLIVVFEDVNTPV